VGLLNKTCAHIITFHFLLYGMSHFRFELMKICYHSSSLLLYLNKNVSNIYIWTSILLILLKHMFSQSSIRTILPPRLSSYKIKTVLLNWIQDVGCIQLDRDHLRFYPAHIRLWKGDILTNGTSKNNKSHCTMNGHVIKEFSSTKYLLWSISYNYEHQHKCSLFIHKILHYKSWPLNLWKQLTKISAYLTTKSLC
jgi:hypothetical protein